MSRTPLINARMLGRALTLGLALFLAFAVAAAGLWALGNALGLGNTAAFLLAACAAPVIVSGIVLLGVFSLPLERRQTLLGVMAQPDDVKRQGQPAAPDGDT